MDEPIKKVIDAVLEEEVGGKPNGGFTNDPADNGGRTQFGISERANPDAWKDNKVTEEEARAIYYSRYVEKPGFIRISDRRLQHFLVDWSVISGPGVVVQYLQRAVGAKVDGVLGPKTAAGANALDGAKLTNQLVDERIRMIGRIVNKNPSQAKWLNGWINRALEFRV